VASVYTLAMPDGVVRPDSTPTPATTRKDPAMAETDVRYELQDGIAWITLDGPQTLNSLAPSTTDKLVEALDKGDHEARVIVVTGTGRLFSSGADLSGPSSAASEGKPAGPPLPPKHNSMEVHYNRVLLRIRDLVTPLITAVNGGAAGGGMSLALAGDLIVATEEAYFLSPFQRIGLGPDLGTSFTITRAVGRVRAMEFFLLSEKLPAAKALEWGLINRVVPAADFEATVRELATRVADGPARALGYSRHAVWRGWEGTLEEALQRELYYLAQLGGAPESKEGMASFAEKRQPDFRSIGY